jgi:hypothetical protein
MSSQVTWLNHFALGVVDATNSIGFDVDAANDAQLDALWLAYVLGAWLSEVRTFNQSATAYLELAASGDAGTLPTFAAPPLPAAVAPSLPATVVRPAGALTRIFAFIQRLKLAPGYTVALGEDLGIEGAEDAADHPTPKITLEVEQGPTCQCVDMTIVKYTHEGVVVESRRGGGAWEQIGLTTARTFEDARALLDPTKPEVREYRARYWDKGVANGPWTEVMKATVAP